MDGRQSEHQRQLRGRAETGWGRAGAEPEFHPPFCSKIMHAHTETRQRVGGVEIVSFSPPLRTDAVSAAYLLAVDTSKTHSTTHTHLGRRVARPFAIRRRRRRRGGRAVEPRGQAVQAGRDAAAVGGHEAELEAGEGVQPPRPRRVVVQQDAAGTPCEERRKRSLVVVAVMAVVVVLPIGYITPRATLGYVHAR